MKKQTFITLSILLCILIGCKENKYFPDTATIYSFKTHLAVPDGLRDIGYDSIQLLVKHDGNIEANFCYYNGLRFKKDTVYTDDTTYRLYGLKMQITPDLYLTSPLNVSWRFGKGTVYIGDVDSVTINGYQIKIKKVQ